VLGFDAAGGARRYDQVLQGWGQGEAGVRFLFPGYDLGPEVGGAVEEDGNRISLLDPTTGLLRWTATLPPVEDAFWTVRSDGRTLYAQTTQPNTTDRIPRIDLATGRLLPPLVLGGGPTDAELWGLLGPLLLFEGSEGAFAVRAGDGTVAWRIPAGGAPEDHLSRDDDILGTIDPVSRLSVSARRDGRGFAVYDLDSGAWLGRRSGDWYSDTPVHITRDGRLTVITTGATARVTCRDASGRAVWRSPVLPGWDLAGDDGYLTASGGLMASLECTHRPGGDGCASFDLVAVQV
jgi:outer membrane protein assembly factor BamB